MVDGDELHVVSHREGKVWLVKVLSLSLSPSPPINCVIN